MKAIRVPSPVQFHSILSSTLAGAKGPVFVVFFGTEDPATNQSWCPDCVTADPLIRQSIARAHKDAILVECPVDRSTYKSTSPLHPYRTDKEIELKRIPTLIHWKAENVRPRLVEEECADSARLDEFVQTASKL